MSQVAHISQEERWMRFEAKSPAFTVTDSAGAAVDLTGVDLQWRIMRFIGTPILTKETPDIVISGASSNVATVSVDHDEYDDLPAGYYHHELWDRDSHLQLAEGDVVLNDATDPEEA